MWRLRSPSGYQATILKTLPAIDFEFCAALENRKINIIRFCGDSLMRHVFQAVQIILSRDFVFGSVCDSTCGGLRQMDVNCRTKLRSQPTVCGGRVSLQMSEHGSDYHPWCRPTFEDVNESDAFVWGGGNHPVPTPYRGDYDTFYGANNAVLVAEHVLANVCPNIKPPLVDRVVFLLPHARTAVRHSVEANFVVRK
jgi:hypothetical protein